MVKYGEGKFRQISEILNIDVSLVRKIFRIPENKLGIFKIC
jgi:hypothetical protein